MNNISKSKVIISISLCLLLSGIGATLLIDYGYAQSSDDWEYTVYPSSNRVTITGYTGTDENIVIPESIEGYPVTTISRNTFKENSTIKTLEILSEDIYLGHTSFYKCNNLKTVIATGDVELDYETFYSCLRLEYVSVGGSLITGDSAFRNCRELISVTAPGGMVMNTDSTFSNCNALTTIPDMKNSTYIGNSAFYKCYSLESISLPNNLENIRTSAFEYCTGLESITIPESVIRISDDAFMNCESLTTIDLSVNNGIHLGNAVFKNSGLVTAILPTEVSNLGSYLFSQCTDLTTVILPSVIDVESKYGWGYDSRYTISDNNRTFAHFKNCDSLTTVIFPEGLVEIPKYTFKNCYSLENIVLPESMDTIRLAAFANCNNLESINLYNVKRIEKQAFDNTSLETLKTLVFREDVQSIGLDAFRNTNIETVKIEGSVYGWDEPFSDCDFLEEIYVINKYKDSPTFSKTKLKAGNDANLIWCNLIKFDSAGGSDISPLFCVVGDSYGTLPTPVKPNHVFTGWQSDGESIRSSDIPTENTTLTAQWLIKEIDYKEPKETNIPISGLFWNHTVSETPGVSIEIINIDTPWINVSGGTISGIPTESGVYEITLKLTASGYAPSTKTLTLDVKPQLMLMNNPQSGAIAFVLN